MITIPANGRGKTIIGRLGENEHKRIAFRESAPALAMYPNASVTVLHQRPGDPTAYPVSSQYVDIVDGVVCWTVQSGDLAKEGDGQCEIILTQNGTVAKLLIYTTEIQKALDGAGTPPDPWESWVQQVTEAAAQAEAAVEHYPQIIDGYWYVWDVEQGEFINTGVPAGSDVSGKADKADTVLDTTLSRGRKAGTTVGTGSFAFGDDVEASGANSHAEGVQTVSSGIGAHAEGGYIPGLRPRGSSGVSGNPTTAAGRYSHAEGWGNHADGVAAHAEGTGTYAEGDASHAQGLYTIVDQDAAFVTGKYNKLYYAFDAWETGHSYAVNDCVVYNSVGYKCIQAHTSSSSNRPGLAASTAYWSDDVKSATDLAMMVGNGASGARSNAFELGWDGTGKFAGDVYADGNKKLATVERVETAEGSAGANALKSEGYAVGTQNGDPVDSSSSYFENNAKYWALLAAAATGKYPKVENGYWYVWDVQNEQWASTGVKATGADGDDGVSPTVTITSITGGQRITVTDADGDHTFDVMDGTTPTVPVQDVHINGTSILNNGVANVPKANDSTLGVVFAGHTYGVYGIRIDGNGELYIAKAEDGNIKGASNNYRPIVSTNAYLATFYGLAKAAGDTTQSESSNAVGTYTETAKSAISQMLNSPVTVSGSTPSITALPGVRYVCGECSTLDITVPASGIIDVVFESGSTATVLTVTPPTGMTMKWIGEDPTALEANKTYEINIKDGYLGMVVSWT